jgi:hypothetical protein
MEQSIVERIQKRLAWMIEMRDQHAKNHKAYPNNINEFALYERYVEGVEQLEWVLRLMEYGN